MEELRLVNYSSVAKYKSIRRAIRRGHVNSVGTEYPKRPFNNRQRTAGRELQVTKEKIYGQIKYHSN